MYQFYLENEIFLIRALENAATRYAENIAICCNGKEINYGTLNGEANQLARHLIQLPLIPDNAQPHSKLDATIRVGFYLPQSIEITLSLLAIMKAGYSFIPLSTDAEISVERLETIVKSAKPQAIITNRKFEHKSLIQIAREQNCHIIYTEDYALIFDQYDSSNLNLTEGIKLHHLAYIYYTSGSTGTPKGVMVPHRNLLNCMNSAISALKVTEKSRVAQLASIGFDASLMEIFIALLCGAKLYLVPRDDTGRLDINELDHFYNQHHIDVGLLTPSLLNLLNPNSFACLKEVIYTGEKAYTKTIERWFAAGQCNGHDGYGPTECTIGATIDGFPIQGVDVFVLKKNRKAAPPNTIGEIYLSGDCVGLGYWDEPVLTGSKFQDIVHPDNPEQKITVYKTGDLGRFQADGTLIIDGRRGRQVKAHGKLICPEEIEATLLRYEDKNMKRIFSNVYIDSISYKDERPPVFIAFCLLDDFENVERQNSFPDIYEMQEFLKEKLTASMIPSRWFLLPANRGMNNNSKLDRKQLWEFCLKNQQNYPLRFSEGYRLFLSDDPDELTLVNLWRQCLELVASAIVEENDGHNLEKKIQVMLKESGEHYSLRWEDHFFYMGGTSIQAAFFLELVEKNLFLKITMFDFLDNPTLGFVIRQMRWKNHKNFFPPPLTCLNGNYSTTELLPADKTPVFLIHSLLGNAKLDYNVLMQTVYPELPIFGLNAIGLSSPEMMGDSLAETVNRYLDAIHIVYQGDLYLLGGWSGGGLAALALQDILHRRQKKACVIMFDTSSPLLFQKMSFESLKCFLLSLVFGKSEEEDPQRSIRERIPLRKKILSSIFNEIFNESHSLWSKQKLIVSLFENIKKQLIVQDDKALAVKDAAIGLLTTIENTLLSVMKQKLPAMTKDIILIPAKQSQERLAKKSNAKFAERLGWPEQWSIKIQNPSVDGDHFFMLEPHLVQGIGFNDLINDLLDQQQASSRGLRIEAQRRGRDILSNPQLFYEAIPWGELPHRNPNFVGREEKLGELRAAFSINKEIATVVTGGYISAQGVVGLGGVGKTQLIAEYVYSLLDEESDDNVSPENRRYALKIWLRGEKALLEADLRELAQWLGFIFDEAKTSMTTIASSVYERLAHLSAARPRVLLIVDDVYWEEGFEYLLPKAQYRKHFHWLLTSREQSVWQEYFARAYIGCLLDTFNDTEVETYFNKAFSPKIQQQADFTFENRKRLAQQLGNFPLALAQAVAYINRTSVLMPLVEYCDLFECQGNYLASIKINSKPERTILTTWFITLSVLLEDRDEGALAINLLLACAYCEGNRIPLSLLRAYCGDTQNIDRGVLVRVREAVRCLVDYSLVMQLTEEAIQVHKLVQQVLRWWMEGALIVKQKAEFGQLEQQLSQKGIEKENVLIILEEALIMHARELAPTLLDIQRQIALIPHLKMLITHWTARNLRQEQDDQQEKQGQLVLAHLYGCLGIIQRLRGSAAAALETNNNALSLYEYWLGKNHIRVAEILSNLSNAYADLGNAKAQKDILKYALIIYENHYGTVHPQLAEILINLANAYYALGEAFKSKKVLKRALIILQIDHISNYPEIARTLTSLANACGALGETKKRKKLLKQALSILIPHYGSAHPKVAIVLGNLGNAYGDLGDVLRGKELLERALKIDEDYYGPEHPEVAKTLTNLGIYYAFIDAKKSKEVLKRALAILKHYYGSDHPDVGKTLGNLGRTYYALGNAKKASGLLARSLKITESYYGTEHPEVAEVLVNLVLAKLSLNKLKVACEYAERSHSIFRRFFGNTHQRTQFSKNLASECQERLREEPVTVYAKLLPKHTSMRLYKSDYLNNPLFELSVIHSNGFTFLSVSARNTYLPVSAEIQKKYRLNDFSVPELERAIREASSKGDIHSVKAFITAAVKTLMVRENHRKLRSPFQGVNSSDVIDSEHSVEKFIKAAKFDINAKSSVSGKTALHWAAICEQPAMVRYLLSLGARSDLLDNYKKTALMYALEKNNDELRAAFSLNAEQPRKHCVLM